MEESVLSKKTFFIILFISLSIVGCLYIYYQIDTNTKVVLCNTGNKLSVYIRVKNKTDIVINPENKQFFLQCISKYQPFYDRHLELVILTAASKYTDLDILLQRFTIGKLFFLSKNKPYFEKNEKITSVINSKENLDLRIAGVASIRMFKSPIQDSHNLAEEGISYWEGKKSFLFIEKLSKEGYLDGENVDYVVFLKPLQISDIVNLKSRATFKNVVLIQMSEEPSSFLKILGKILSNVNIVRLKKYEYFFIKT